MKLVVMNENPKKKNRFRLKAFLAGLLILLLAAALYGLIQMGHRKTERLNGTDPDAVVTRNTASTVQYGGTGVIHKDKKTLDYVFTNPEKTGKYYRFRIVKGETDVAVSGVIAPGHEVKAKKDIRTAGLEQGTVDARIEISEVEPKTQEVKEQQEAYVCLKVLP